MILVDYHCKTCSLTVEALVPSPAPAQRPCATCGSMSRRRFATAGLTGRAARPAAGSVDCVDNPGVPGLCHVGPAAKRSLIARHLGDGDTLAAEQARQESVLDRTGKPENAFAHSHTTVEPNRSRQ